MDSLTGIFLSSFLIAFSGAVMPGPVLTVTISESMKRGFIAGPMIILGHGILEVGLIAVIMMGFADLLNRPDAMGVIGIAGGAVLLWFSYGMVRNLKGSALDLLSTESRSGSPVMAGILTSLANPYWTLWWVTIGLGYVAMAMPFGVVGIAIFFLGHVGADLVWYSGVSYLVSKGKRYISSRIYQGITLGCAIVLAFFAAYFAMMGAKYFTT